MCVMTVGSEIVLHASGVTGLDRSVQTRNGRLFDLEFTGGGQRAQVSDTRQWPAETCGSRKGSRKGSSADSRGNIVQGASNECFDWRFIAG